MDYSIDGNFKHLKNIHFCLLIPSEKHKDRLFVYAGDGYRFIVSRVTLPEKIVKKIILPPNKLTTLLKIKYPKRSYRRKEALEITVNEREFSIGRWQFERVSYDDLQGTYPKKQSCLRLLQDFQRCFRDSIPIDSSELYKIFNKFRALSDAEKQMREFHELRVLTDKHDNVWIIYNKTKKALNGCIGKDEDSDDITGKVLLNLNYIIGTEPLKATSLAIVPKPVKIREYEGDLGVSLIDKENCLSWILMGILKRGEEEE